MVDQENKQRIMVTRGPYNPVPKVYFPNLLNGRFKKGRHQWPDRGSSRAQGKNKLIPVWRLDRWRFSLHLTALSEQQIFFLLLKEGQSLPSARAFQVIKRIVFPSDSSTDDGHTLTKFLFSRGGRSWKASWQRWRSSSWEDAWNGSTAGMVMECLLDETLEERR